MIFDPPIAQQFPKRIEWIEWDLHNRLTCSSGPFQSVVFQRCVRSPTMSWDEYIQDELMQKELKDGTGQYLSFAAIIGLDGAVWAQSSDFPDVAPEQLDALIGAFEDQAEVREKGIQLGETRYIVFTAEDTSVIRGKKGAAGFTAKKTKTALVVGGYGEGTQPGLVNVLVENVADALVEDEI